MSDKTLQEKLRIKSSMIFLGERIAFGSECELMDLAADCIDTQQATIERLTEQRDELLGIVKAFSDGSGVLKPIEKTISEIESSK